MLKADFKMDHSSDISIFGRAIYFSSSPDIRFYPMRGGKKIYTCKFEITLEEPLLDMNREIPVFEANRLLNDFRIILENKNPTYLRELQNYNFESEFKDTIQMGEFFDTIYTRHVESSKYFDYFIHNYLKYNSFQYFQNSLTDYITEKEDYGISYGVYDKKNIKFIDGPF
jgi:hypothetical protein